MTYQSPDDARTDFFLAAGVHLLGPLILGTLVFDVVQLRRDSVAAAVYSVVQSAATTALVPYLLLRYRRDTFRGYGFGRGLMPLLVGVVLVLPLVALDVATGLLRGARPTDALPVVALVEAPDLVIALLILDRVVFWVGLAFMVLFLTIKARDAFRPQSLSLAAATRQVLLVVVAGGVGAVLLLALFQGANVLLALGVLGVAGSVLLTLRWQGRDTDVDRWTVYAPVLVAALGPFAASLQAVVLLGSLRSAALVGGIALAMVVLVESRRASETLVGMGLAVALLAYVGGFVL